VVSPQCDSTLSGETILYRIKHESAFRALFTQAEINCSTKLTCTLRLGRLENVVQGRVICEVCLHVPIHEAAIRVNDEGGAELTASSKAAV